LPLEEMVPYFSTQAAVSKFPRKIFRRRLEIVLEGSNRFEKKIELMNTASKLGPHTQTDRGTCPGVGL
jgi:predicted metal-dependent hydrolase